MVEVAVGRRMDSFRAAISDSRADLDFDVDCLRTGDSVVGVGELDGDSSLRIGNWVVESWNEGVRWCVGEGVFERVENEAFRF